MIENLSTSFGLWWLAVAIAVAGLAVLASMRLWSGRQSRSPAINPGYVRLVVGLRGHGKSLFVARLIAERLDAGVPVVANFTVSGGVARMEEWRDVVLAPRGSMVVLDEAYNWAGARAGVTLRPAAVWYISQSRKLGHEVWIVSQHENQIAGAVRDQVNEIVECRKRPRGWHRAATYAPHEFRKRDAQTLWAWWYQPKGRCVEVYDTMDLVPPERSRGRSFDQDFADILEWIEIIKARSGPSGPGEPELDADELVAGWLAEAGMR